MSENGSGEGDGRRNFLKVLAGTAIGGLLGWEAHKNAPQIKQAVEDLGERTSREAIDPQAKKASQDVQASRASTPTTEPEARATEQAIKESVVAPGTPPPLSTDKILNRTPVPTNTPQTPK